MGTRAHTARHQPRARLSVRGRSGIVIPLAIVCLLALLAAPGAFCAESTPAAEAKSAGEAETREVEFVDVLLTPTPLPGTDVSVAYRFERTRERDDTIGSIHRHGHEVSLGLSYQVTEWLGIGVGIPYSLTDVRTLDPATGSPVEPDTRNIGDITLTPLATFYKNPAWRFAVGGALELGLPTGSFRDGTGGQWSVKPSLIVGQWIGPVQILGDIGFGAELRRLVETDARGRELSYNVAAAYPLLNQRLIPFLELNGAYVFQGDPALKHRGQLYLTPGIRIAPFAAAEVEAKAGESPRKAEPSWWNDLSFAVGLQLPVTASRAFEWGITSALKLGF